MRKIIGAASKTLFVLAYAMAMVSYPQTSSAQPQGLPVTVQLNWMHQFEFAAFYAAIEQGYYRDVGLEVSLREGGPGIDMVSEVLSGRAQFGVGNSSLVLERHRGKPVVALGALMQHSAVALLGSRERGINTVEDLAGKVVQCPPHACDEVRAYLKTSGVRPDKVTFVPFSSRVATERLKVADATEVYASNDGFTIVGQQHRYVLLLPRSAGIDLYGNVLFTSDDVLNRRPELVEKFRQATFKGLHYAMTHHEETTRLILAKYNTQGKSAAHLGYEAARLTELIRTDLVEPGYMSQGRWNHVRDTYAELGLIPRNFELDDFVYSTNPFAGHIETLRRYLAITLGVLLLGVGGGFYIVYLNRRLARSHASLVEANARLTHMAHYDALTKVPNRILFYDRLDQGLKRARRNQTKLALMAIDLDKFKPVNDTYGHAVGDQVLQSVATRLQETIRQADSVGRIGGDEFVILLPEIDSDQSAVLVAEKALEAVTRPIVVDGLTISIAMSVGIAIYPDHGETEIELIKNADAAMYFAKAHGRHQVVVFHPERTMPDPA